MKYVIFDIDGTLVHSHEFDGACYRQAVQQTLGDVSIRSDWSDYKHVTDEGILREIYTDNQLEFINSTAVRTTFGRFVIEHLHDNPLSCVEIPGARALMETLRKNSLVRVGIATGGWRHTAKAKLDHAKINYEDVSLFSSDDGFRRIDIMDLCRQELGCSPQDITYVGDGEWDKQATETLGWSFIGVGLRLKGKCANWISDFKSINFEELID